MTFFPLIARSQVNNDGVHTRLIVITFIIEPSNLGRKSFGRRTCDVVLLEGVAVDLVLVGTVLLQPLAHILLRPQGHRL